MKKTLRYLKRSIFLMLLIPLISFAQLEIPEGYTIVTKSPANGNKIEQLFLDFDTDGLEDTVVLVENTSEFSAYKFILYMSSHKKSYAVDLISLNESSIHPVQIKTKKNVVEFGYYEDGTAAYGRFIKLRYNPISNQIQVIGYDVAYKSLPTEHITKSHNLITGEYSVEKTIYDENGKVSIQKILEKNAFFKNTVFIENLNASMLESLDAIGSEFEKSKTKAKIDKFNLGEDIAEINCYVKNIYRKDNLTFVDIDIVQVKYTSEGGERIIINENPKTRTYIVDDTTIIYAQDCESVTPEKLTEIEKSLLDDKSIIVVGSSKDGVLESINFGCYG